MKPAELLLAALKDSVREESWPHLGHEELIELIEKQMEAAYNRAPRIPPVPSLKPEIEYVQGKDKVSKQCKIYDKAEKIKEAFADFVIGVESLLVRTAVPVDKVRMALISFCNCITEQERSKNLLNAQTIADLLGYFVLYYASWFNYQPIKFIAERFCGQEGKLLLLRYEEEIKLYLEDIIAYECPEFSPTREMPPGYESLTIKLMDQHYQTYPIKQVISIENTLAKLFEIQAENFILKNIEEGCIQLTWAIPCFGISKIISALQSKSCIDILQSRYGAISIQLSGKTVDLLMKDMDMESDQNALSCSTTPKVPQASNGPDKDLNRYFSVSSTSTSTSTLCPSSLSPLSLSRYSSFLSISSSDTAPDFEYGTDHDASDEMFSPIHLNTVQEDNPNPTAEALLQPECYHNADEKPPSAPPTIQQKPGPSYQHRKSSLQIPLLDTLPEDTAEQSPSPSTSAAFPNRQYQEQQPTREIPMLESEPVCIGKLHYYKLERRDSSTSSASSRSSSISQASGVPPITSNE